jgi:hypothetical protein
MPLWSRSLIPNVPVNSQSPQHLRTFGSGEVWLIPGDIRLVEFEAELPLRIGTQCIAGKPGSFDMVSAHL